MIIPHLQVIQEKVRTSMVPDMVRYLDFLQAYAEYEYMEIKRFSFFELPAAAFDEAGNKALDKVVDSNKETSIGL
jgi:hypothetical protein